jgi:hypothetical protein
MDAVTARRLEITPAEYLADPAPEPSLSCSIAKLLTDQEHAPAHAYLAHPRLGGQPSASTPATDHGSLVHRLLLEAGPVLKVVDAADWRTKAAKQEREEARERGEIPVLASDAIAAAASVMTIKGRLGDAGITLEGESEVVLMWQEQAEHGIIWARGMLDHVVPRFGKIHVYDLKTCRSAHPVAIDREVIKYGYEVQEYVYTRAAEMAWPEYEGRVEFSFLFVEKEPPHCVTVAKCDGIKRERGRRRWHHAVETWSRCLHTDTWPGYATEPVTLWSPDWLLKQEEMQR